MIEPAGYIELGMVGNKGARSDTQKRLVMPVVAPMMTLSGNKWWDSWLSARRELGLTVDGELTLPLLCKFGSSGEPLNHPLLASEIGSLFDTL